MKFLYEYRTSDNVQHAGAVRASSRDAAYRRLKELGIRPGRLEAAPGILNALLGRGKRWTLIAVLSAGIVAALLTAGRAERKAKVVTDIFDMTTRRQPIGDAAIIDKGVRTGWADVFVLEGDRFLASFAVPGTEPAIRSTTEEKLKEALHSSDSPDGRAALDLSSIESRQIRAIVSGMKQELREFIADGGTIRQYGRRLVQRQEQEIGYFNRVKNEIEGAAKAGVKGAALVELWEKRNATLRTMGIRLVPLPE